MKTVSAALEAHLAQEVATLATCWKITRTDGAVYGFTDHITDLTVSGLVYNSSSGYTATAISTDNKLSVDNLDVEGFLDSNYITEAEVVAGLWDYAAVEIFQVNYSDLSQGTLKLRKGTLGNITLKRIGYVAELRGMMQPLQQTIGETYSAACSADLGDARCKVNMASYTDNGTVSTVTSNRQWTDSSLVAASGYYTGGLVTWLTGSNAGLKMEVKTYTVGSVLLQIAVPFAVQAGDTYTIKAGCDKFKSTCKNTFNNVTNFRGFPDVPGTDKVLQGK